MWTGAVRTRASTRGMGRRCVSCNAMCSLRLFSLMCSVSLFTGEEMSDRQRGDENKVAEDDNGHLVVEVVKRDLLQCQKRPMAVPKEADHSDRPCSPRPCLPSPCAFGLCWLLGSVQGALSHTHSLVHSLTHSLSQSLSHTNTHTHTHTHSFTPPHVITLCIQFDSKK